MNRFSVRAVALLLCLLICFLSLPVIAEELTDDDPWSYSIRHGSRDTKMIAITVDDCAHPNVVENIFRLCESYQISVTFFPVGRNLKQADAALWQEIAASPYAEIGSHSQKHYDWHKSRTATIRQDLQEFMDTLDSVLGYHYETTLVRPPYGHCSRTKNGNRSKLIDMTTALGYRHVILWDVSQTNASKAINDVKNGSILLYHANGKDYRCLKTLIPKLLKKGFIPVKVSTLLGLPSGGPADSTDAPEQESPQPEELAS